MTTINPLDQSVINKSYDSPTPSDKLETSKESLPEKPNRTSFTMSDEMLNFFNMVKSELDNLEVSSKEKIAEMKEKFESGGLEIISKIQDVKTEACVKLANKISALEDQFSGVSKDVSR